MRLIEHIGGTQPAFTPYLDESPPRYAILSHTWEEGQEVTYEDFLQGREVTSQKSGWNKIDFCLQKSDELNLSHFWIDSACINKRNDDETAEITKSMFSWYERSDVCLVYLSNISKLEDIHKARWWTRGWTLQELLAPANVRFYSKEWTFLGTKWDLQDKIHNITGIPIEALLGEPLWKFSIKERISCMKGRKFTYPEDYELALNAILGTEYALRYGKVQLQRQRKHQSPRHKINQKDHKRHTRRTDRSSTLGPTRDHRHSVVTGQDEWDLPDQEVTLEDLLSVDAFKEPGYQVYPSIYTDGSTPSDFEDHQHKDEIEVQPWWANEGLPASTDLPDQVCGPSDKSPNSFNNSIGALEIVKPAVGLCDNLSCRGSVYPEDAMTRNSHNLHPNDYTLSEGYIFQQTPHDHGKGSSSLGHQRLIDDEDESTALHTGHNRHHGHGKGKHVERQYDRYQDQVSSSRTHGWSTEDTYEAPHSQSSGGLTTFGDRRERRSDFDDIYQQTMDGIIENDLGLNATIDNMNLGCDYLDQDYIRDNTDGYMHSEDQFPAESHRRRMKKESEGKGKDRYKRRR